MNKPLGKLDKVLLRMLPRLFPQSIAQTAAQIRLDPQHAVSQSDNWTQLRSQDSDSGFQWIPTPNSDSDVRILSAEVTKKQRLAILATIIWIISIFVTTSKSAKHI